MKLYTSSWFVKLPEDHLRVGISCSTPRRISGFRRLRALEPGLWFNSASPEEFHKLYMAQLNALDVATIVARLEAMAADAQAVAVVLLRGAARWRLVSQVADQRLAARPVRARSARVWPRGLRRAASAAVAQEVTARCDGKAG